MGLNPVVGTTKHKATVNSAIHPSEIGKLVLRSNSEGTSTGHTLITAYLKLKCSIIQFKDFWFSFLFFSKVWIGYVEGLV